MRIGVHPLLEAEADRIIRESLRGVTSRAAKSDILTPWKEKQRRSREVYVAEGTPDPSRRRGLFGRGLNTQSSHLNSTDGVLDRRRNGRTSISDSLASHIQDDG